MDDLTEAAVDAIEDAVRKSTIGIVSGSGDLKWKGLGTGSLIKWHGQTVILTAFHVVGQTDAKDLRFFFPTDSPPKKVDREVILGIPGLKSSKMHPFSEVPILAVHADEELDLLAIAIPPDSVAEDSAVVFNMAAGESTPPPETAIVALGVPRDISRLTRSNARVVFPRIEWSTVASAHAGVANFDATLHFLAPYPTEGAHPDSHPLGLSGATFWYRKGNTPLVWHPNLELAGVILAWYPIAKRLKVARREAVEQFLAQHVG